MNKQKFREEYEYRVPKQDMRKVWNRVFEAEDDWKSLTKFEKFKYYVNEIVPPMIVIATIGMAAFTAWSAYNCGKPVC